MTNETLDLFELRIQENLKELEHVRADEARDKIVKETERLATQLTNAETLIEKSVNDRELREADEAKRAASEKSDKRKTILDGIVKVGCTIAQVAIPAAISIVTLKVWDVKFEEMMKFEETGRFVSTASKNIKLPRIF